METMERTEAATRGLSKYFTGRPCKRGHVAHRYTYNGNCSKCASMRTSKYTKLLADAKKVDMASATKIEFKRYVPAYLVEGLDAMIAADNLTPRPCPYGCTPGTTCFVCDRGDKAVQPPTPTPGLCPNSCPPGTTCHACDTSGGRDALELKATTVAAGADHE